MPHKHQNTLNAVATKPIIQKITREPELEHKPRNHRWLLFLIAISAILYFAKETKEHWEAFDFLEKGPDGKPQPAAKDLERLQRDLEEIDDSEQYVLWASEAGYYACYTCLGQDSIYLYAGEVWYYGITRKGKDGRYPQGLEDPRLRYRVQFKGNYAECWKQEKRKIIYYRTLPENLKRANPIKLPPGNNNR